MFFICTKYAGVPFKDTITNAFQKILDEFNQKSGKIWAGKGCEFYSRSTKFWLEDSDIEMYSVYNEKNMLLLKDLLEL